MENAIITKLVDYDAELEMMKTRVNEKHKELENEVRNEFVLFKIDNLVELKQSELEV